MYLSNATILCETCFPPCEVDADNPFSIITANSMEAAISNCSTGIVRLKAILYYLQKTLANDIDYYVTNYAARLPKCVKRFIEQEMDSVSMQNIQYFYEYLMTSMAESLSQDLCVLGFKILIQILAWKYPEVTEQCMANMAVLRNTFEDNEKICLKLLWGFSQGGYKDVNTGIRIWLNLMLPIMHMPRYSGYICRYIARMAEEQALKCLKLTGRDFQLTIESLVDKHPLCDEYVKVLSDSAQKIARRYIEVTDNLLVPFIVLLRNTTDKNNFAQAIVECLWLDPSHVAQLWEAVLLENVHQTYLILTHIDNNWSQLSMCLSKMSAFVKFLEKAKIVPILTVVANSILKQNNSNAMEKQQQQQQQQQQSQKKAADSKKNAKTKGGSGGAGKGGASAKESGSKCSCCKWVIGSLMMIIGIVAAINYDVMIHGGQFANSASGKALKDAGLLPYAETAYFAAMTNGARGYQWLAQNVPIYTSKAGVVLRPYWDFIKDFTLVVRNSAVQGGKWAFNVAEQKSPVLVDFMEQYAPGLANKMKETFIKSWVFVSNSSYDVFQNCRQFVNEKVLIGKLSPENLNRMLNETQLMAADYYSWFNKKVDEYAKI